MSKNAVRDRLRADGREDRWTEMQGTVYGARMAEAAAFPGVEQFFAGCRRAGLPVFIVSHKTRKPYRGEPHDLHRAARNWLELQGFLAADRIGLSADAIFFEETLEGKLARVGELGCTHFIDDLPELLGHAAFPANVERILFDPNGAHGGETRYMPARSWAELSGRLLR